MKLLYQRKHRQGDIHRPLSRIAHYKAEKVIQWSMLCRSMEAGVSLGGGRCEVGVGEQIWQGSRGVMSTNFSTSLVNFPLVNYKIFFLGEI